MDNGWNNCGCGTTYTDAWGQVINREQYPSNTSGCSVDWGLLACAAVAAVVALVLGKGN